MSRDELDGAMARLFAAGREERPATEARRGARVRVREQVARTPRTSWRWQLGLAAAAAVLGAVAVSTLWSRDVDVALEPDRALAPPSTPPVATEDRSAVAEPRPSTRPAPLPAVRPPPPPPAPTLEEELAALRDARAALQAGNSDAALEQLDRYERRGRRLRVEATVLRIEALAAAGRSAEATALARRFVVEHPTNPLVDRVRAIIVDSENVRPD